MSDECRAGLCDPMWQRESELGDHELFDVWSAHVIRLFDLHHSKDLPSRTASASDKETKGINKEPRT
jgi:hypothetical protein